MRIVAAVLEAVRPPLASTGRTARIALDELAAMASLATFPASQVALPVPFEALQADDLERIARTAQLPEVEAIDFRREQGQELTEPEREAWGRIEHFAQLVLAAAAARETHQPTSSTGTGPDAAA